MGHVSGILGSVLAKHRYEREMLSLHITTSSHTVAVLYTMVYIHKHMTGNMNDVYSNIAHPATPRHLNEKCEIEEVKSGNNSTVATGVRERFAFIWFVVWSDGCDRKR